MLKYLDNILNILDNIFLIFLIRKRFREGVVLKIIWPNEWWTRVWTKVFDFTLPIHIE